MSTPREIQAVVLQGPVLSPMLYILYINYASKTPGTQLALFADHTCIYATDRKEGFKIRKLQHGLTPMEARCEHWNVKIKEDKTQAIYFSHGNRPVESHLALKERNILFVSNVKYLGEFRQKRSMVTTYTKD